MKLKPYAELWLTMASAFLITNCYSRTQHGVCGTGSETTMMENVSRNIGSPSYKSFSVQDYTQTGMIQIIQVRRDPKTGELISQGFFETQNHGGEFRASKPVEWKEKIPDGLALRGASAGNVNDYIQIYWASWIDTTKATALAISQEDPITAPMLAGDEPIHAPIQAMDRKLRLFFWRKSGTGFSLYNHVFSGELKQKGTVHTDKLLDIPYQPGLTQAEPIAMQWVRNVGFKDAGLAVIGWLSSDGSGMKVHAAWLDGKSVKVFDSAPIAGYQPFPKQRLGIWCDPDGILRMAWLMGRIDTDTLRLAEWTLNGQSGTHSLRIHEDGFPGEHIYSAALVIPRIPEDKKSPEINAVNCFTLSDAGRLQVGVDGQFRSLRSDLPITYDFPIFASAVGIWEAGYDGKGEITFTSP